MFVVVELGAGCVLVVWVVLVLVLVCVSVVIFFLGCVVSDSSLSSSEE